ncbi:MAG: hypothetical protein Q8M94_19380 [Ignavibacteria bacterium]|nr:hypothetical protein [Ignavibacteria bacterium]
MSGRATVRYAVDGNINPSDGGHMKTFTNFSAAKVFAKKKAKEYGVTADIHPK